MALSRGVASLLAYLVVLPLVAVAADMGQRSLEAEDVPAGPLREKALFVYDVTLLSDLLATASTAAGALTIETSEIHYDADDRPFLTVTSHRDPLPWDRVAREPWTTEKMRADGAYRHTLEETVSVTAGRTTHAEWSIQEKQVYASGSTGYQLTFLKDSHVPAGSPDGTVAALAAYMSDTWRYEDGFWESRLLGSSPGPLEKGTYMGRTVYAKSTTTTDSAEGMPFACDLALPGLVHNEWPAMKEHRDDHITVDTTLTVWRDPTLPVPAAVDCHATHYDHDEELGHIRVIATLTKTKTEGRTLDVDWNDPAYGRPFGDLVARPTNKYGVPQDGSSSEGGFRFPLSAAWSAIQSWQDPSLDAFRSSDADPPYVVAHAAYWPGDAVEVCEPLPADIDTECSDRSGILPDLGAPRAVNLRPRWEIVLENAERDLLGLLVERNMTVSGQIIEDTVERIWSDHMPAARDSMYDVAPQQLVPVETAFQAWLDEHGHNAEAWHNHPNAFLSYQLRSAAPDDDGEPVYRFWDPGLQNAAKHRGVGDPGESGSYSVHRASDGALLEEGTQSYTQKQVPQQTAARMPAQDFALPVGNEHTPTAAIIVGVAVTAAFAGFHFSETTRTWLRRLVFLPLFTKLSRDRVLEHRTREAMVHFVEGNPGVGTEEVRRQHDVGWGTAVYHLNALEEKGILVSLKQGGARHWFSTRSHDRRAMAAHAILRSPASKRAYDAIAGHQGLTQQELAAELGVTHGAVIFQVRKLVQAGLVKKQRDGRFVRYFVAEARPLTPSVAAAE